MKNFILLFSSLLLTAKLSATTPDSLAINTFTMHGDVREKGMIGLKLDNEQSAVFNLTSNCNTAQCAHGMAGMRIDQNGHLLHYKKFGHVSIDVDPIKAIWTTDKHILLVGLHGQDRILMKVDTMFNVVWARQFYIRQDNGAILNDDLQEVSGSYYMSFDNTMAKIRPDGTVVFSKIFGPEQGTTDDFKYVFLNTLTPLPGGRFFMGGGIDVGPLPWDGEVGFMMIVDTTGAILKQKSFTLGAPWGEEITWAFRQSENVIRTFGRYESDLYTAEVDTNLVMSNVKRISGASSMPYQNAIHYNGTDRYMIGFSHQGMTLIALDNTGSLEWAGSYSGGYSPYSVYPMNNCTYAMYGTCNTATPNWKKGYWIKVNEDGQSAAPQLEMAFTPTFNTLSVLSTTTTTTVDSGQWQTDFTIQNFLNDNSPVSDSLWYRNANPLVCPDLPQNVLEIASASQKNLCAPNPFHGQMQIGNDWELNKIEKLMVYDITGRIILEQNKPSARTIELTENVKGLIFVKWTYEGVAYTQKMMAL